ncbi:MAG: hypothetical protein JWN30_1919, partial [Bacilli bacterium]|nr:hypothetical protein [Bacilli bacterium]
SERLASPHLQEAWPEIKHASAEPGDWCKRPEDLLHLLQTNSSVLPDISFAGQHYDVYYHYCTGMRTMLAAAKAWTLLTESD